MMNSKDKIVFYDGDCGFCNRIVTYVLKNDRTKQIKFATIQSDYTSFLFKELGLEKPDLSTFYFLDKGKMNIKSTAALRLGYYLKFPQSIVQVFWILPRFVRDAGYDFIAKRRKRLSRSYCAVPTREEQSRFIN